MAKSLIKEWWRVRFINGRELEKSLVESLRHHWWRARDTIGGELETPLADS